MNYMATKIRMHTSHKQVVRFKRKRRIRAKIEGSVERPRLAFSVRTSTSYAQLVDDDKGHTLVAASTLEEE